MTDQGYIKLHRSILKWEWYDDANTKIVFLHLLLNAQWEDTRYRGIEIPKGSLIVGRKKLAKEIGISERAVRTALTHLKSTNEVTIKTTNGYSLVTIVNWEKFQGLDSKSTNEVTNKMTNERPTSDQRVTTIKEIKNIRNKEDKKYSPYQTGRNPDFIALLEMESKGAVNK